MSRSALVLCAVLSLVAVPAFAQVGIIRTVAGTGANDFAGDGGQAQNADINFPEAVSVDSVGNIYIVDSANNRIRMIAAQGGVTGDGIISTFAGNGNAGSTGDGGKATSATLNRPYGIAIDSSDNVYVGELQGFRVRKITQQGIITTVAGTGVQGYGGDGGQAINAQLGKVTSVAIDPNGNLLIADSSNNRVRRVTPAGVISTIAGNGSTGATGDGGLATNATITSPTGVAADARGNVYIASAPLGKVRKVDVTGLITLFAGAGPAGYSGDGGAATSATLNSPYSVATDAAGNVYISDTNNSVIRKVTNGAISTIAGSGSPGYFGDGADATLAYLNTPYSVYVDAAGGVFIADASNDNVRLITYPPVFTASSVLLDAGFVSGGIVPGSIYAVFGSGFARAPFVANGLPSGFLADVQVLMNGIAMY